MKTFLILFVSMFLNFAAAAGEKVPNALNLEGYGHLTQGKLYGFNEPMHIFEPLAAGDGKDLISFYIRTADYSDWWSLTINVPEGETIRTGSYLVQSLFSEDPARVGLSLSGEGRASVVTDGWINIRSLKWGSNGMPKEMAVDFYQEGLGHPVLDQTWGTFRFNSDIPPTFSVPETDASMLAGLCGVLAFASIRRRGIFC